MKSFLVTLLIIGAAFLGYDYYLTPPQRRIVFERPPVVPQREPVVTESSPKKKTLSAPVPEAVSEPVPVAEAPRPVVPTPPADGKPVFKEPKFATIESLTKGWTQIPKSAFPRPVKLLKDATFTLGAGSSVVRASSMITPTAIFFPNGTNTRLPTSSFATSAAR